MTKIWVWVNIIQAILLQEGLVHDGIWVRWVLQLFINYNELVLDALTPSLGSSFTHTFSQTNVASVVFAFLPDEIILAQALVLWTKLLKQKAVEHNSHNCCSMLSIVPLLHMPLKKITFIVMMSNLISVRQAHWHMHYVWYCCLLLIHHLSASSPSPIDSISGVPAQGLC